jgi:hypothetical protein
MAIYRSFRCIDCGMRNDISEAELLSMLRSKGFLKRQAEPSAALLEEILQNFLATGAGLRCENCGAKQEAVASLESTTDWGDVRCCKACKAVIPAERLEIFPDSEYCATCQHKQNTTTDADYCPNCGNVLQLKLITQGRARYQSFCPSCRKTF